MGSVQTETICVMRRSVKERVDCAETRLGEEGGISKGRVSLAEGAEMEYPLSQKEPPINNDADVFESHFGRKAEKSGTVCRESFAGEFEELDEILSDIWLVFNDD